MGGVIPILVIISIIVTVKYSITMATNVDWQVTPGRKLACAGDDVTLIWRYYTPTTISMTFLNNLTSGQTIVTCYFENNKYCKYYQESISKNVSSDQVKSKYTFPNISPGSSMEAQLRLAGPENAANTAELVVVTEPVLVVDVLAQNETISSSADQNQSHNHTCRSDCDYLPILVKTSGGRRADINITAGGEILSYCNSSTSCIYRCRDDSKTINITVDHGICRPIHIQLDLDLPAASAPSPAYIAGIVISVVVLLVLVVLVILVILRRCYKLPECLLPAIDPVYTAAETCLHNCCKSGQEQKNSTDKWRPAQDPLLKPPGEPQGGPPGEPPGEPPDDITTGTPGSSQPGQLSKLEGGGDSTQAVQGEQPGNTGPEGVGGPSGCVVICEGDRRGIQPVDEGKLTTPPIVKAGDHQLQTDKPHINRAEPVEDALADMFSGIKISSPTSNPDKNPSLPPPDKKVDPPNKPSWPPQKYGPYSQHRGPKEEDVEDSNVDDDSKLDSLLEIESEQEIPPEDNQPSAANQQKVKVNLKPAKLIPSSGLPHRPSTAEGGPGDTGYKVPETPIVYAPPPDEDIEMEDETKSTKSDDSDL